MIDKGMKPEMRNLLIEKILRGEWSMFQQVENIGGKAACQEEWPTFRIMRYSYYDAWSDKMLTSYMTDLEEAENKGRNLITEKYAYMMAYTDPRYYREKLAPYLPSRKAEELAMIDKIVDFLIECENAFASTYPKISSKGRPVSSDSDREDLTSAETYARGELMTYSCQTLRLFYAYVQQCIDDGTNFVLHVKERMVRMYGYASLEDAERKM